MFSADGFIFFWPCWNDETVTSGDQLCAFILFLILHPKAVTPDSGNYCGKSLLIGRSITFKKKDLSRSHKVPISVTILA